ncbi:hypothetical protein [Apibacter sp. HY039]|uniref:hypothetical protein n=1 Tax=Apibacter sp. HY039 TaxID=2501476 RepID=UPI000FEB9BEC|nr:hypothetical protein [Apibacter sp. HY039]
MRGNIKNNIFNICILLVVILNLQCRTQESLVNKRDLHDSIDVFLEKTKDVKYEFIQIDLAMTCNENIVFMLSKKSDIKKDPNIRYQLYKYKNDDILYCVNNSKEGEELEYFFRPYFENLKVNLEKYSKYSGDMNSVLYSVGLFYINKKFYLSSSYTDDFIKNNDCKWYLGAK